MSDLKDILLRQIARDGPISIATYMQTCLSHPEQGYYVTRDPLGESGDFTTAPEISQMFGEMVGLWLAHVWMDQGKPDCILAEFGPGRGTLMADILRATASVPGFHDAVSLWLIEISPVLKAKQKETLAKYQVNWTGTVSDLPQDKPLFVVANEFFDALPVRQFLRQENLWCERMIGGDKSLKFGLAPPLNMPVLSARCPQAVQGTIVETCAMAEAVAQELGAAISTSGGAALFIDYGDWEGVGDTLQALKNHEFADVLNEPGQADLTAHVGFRWLVETCSDLRAQFSTQGTFLEHLGITARAQALSQQADYESISQQHRRLTHPEEMGKLFKVLALTPTDAPLSPGFAI